MLLLFCGLLPAAISLLPVTVATQFVPEDFHGRTETDDGSLLYFDGESPENVTTWEWESQGANGRTWHWDNNNGTAWTTWLWSSTGPQANHGGGFLLSAPETKNSGKSEAMIDGARNCYPCGGAAWVLQGPVLTWTTPPEDNVANCSKWMMQQGDHCWGFTSRPTAWGFVFENVTVQGDKGGPGVGACAFPTYTVAAHPVAVVPKPNYGSYGGVNHGGVNHGGVNYGGGQYGGGHYGGGHYGGGHHGGGHHGGGNYGGGNYGGVNSLGGLGGLGGLMGFGGFPVFGGFGFGGLGGLGGLGFLSGLGGFGAGFHGFRNSFGFRGFSNAHWGAGGYGLGGYGSGGYGSGGYGSGGYGSGGYGSGGYGLGGYGSGGLGGCPHAGFVAHRFRRDAGAVGEAEAVDDALDEMEKKAEETPGWGAGVKRWLRRARDFLSSILKADEDDRDKGGWMIPVGEGYVRLGPHLLRKMSGWIGGAVLTVLGGTSVDPKTREAIEAILLDPNVIEVIRNVTEEETTVATGGG